MVLCSLWKAQGTENRRRMLLRFSFLFNTDTLRSYGEFAWSALMNGGMCLDVCESFPWRFRSFAKANLATLLLIKFIVLPHDYLLHFRWAETLLNFIEFSLFLQSQSFKKVLYIPPETRFPFFWKIHPFYLQKAVFSSKLMKTPPFSCLSFIFLFFPWI